MPVDYRILTDPTLVYIRYFDHVTPIDILTSLRRFKTEAAEYVGQPHLFDLSKVTSFDIDYPDFFKLLGELVDLYPASSGEHLFVFFAPEGTPADLAAELRKPYDGSHVLLIRHATTQSEALDILGTRRTDLIKTLEGVV